MVWHPAPICWLDPKNLVKATSIKSVKSSPLWLRKPRSLQTIKHIGANASSVDLELPLFRQGWMVPNCRKFFEVPTRDANSSAELAVNFPWLVQSAPRYLMESVLLQVGGCSDHAAPFFLSLPTCPWVQGFLTWLDYFHPPVGVVGPLSCSGQSELFTKVSGSSCGIVIYTAVLKYSV